MCLQVSDIDGTMIGDMSDPDALCSSQRFQLYWENSAALFGSLLVYNTGGWVRAGRRLNVGWGGAQAQGWVGVGLRPKVVWVRGEAVQGSKGGEDEGGGFGGVKEG